MDSASHESPGVHLVHIFYIFLDKTFQLHGLDFSSNNFMRRESRFGGSANLGEHSRLMCSQRIVSLALLGMFVICPCLSRVGEWIKSANQILSEIPLLELSHFPWAWMKA